MMRCAFRESCPDKAGFFYFCNYECEPITEKDCDRCKVDKHIRSTL
jgi:hypothetical protein